MSKKPLFVLLYGGRSSEHEISCRSAAYVVKHLDREKWDLALIGIDRDGRFVPQDSVSLRNKPPESLPIQSGGAGPRELAALEALDPRRGFRPDQSIVVFPIVHGTGGEDGALQGLLDLCGLPYIGADLTASAVCMDKVLTKRLVAEAGVPVVPYIFMRGAEWRRAKESYLDAIYAKIDAEFLFVKPTSLGSSVGVSRVDCRDDLSASIDKALVYDHAVMVEQGIKAREIEFAVMGGYSPEMSPPGEPVSTGKFYSYDAKYRDKATPVADKPARLSEDELRLGKEIAFKAYQALGLYGMARVDLFLTHEGEYFLNEVNTIPGFTEISQFPLMWQAAGLIPEAILDRLAELAIARFEVHRTIKRAHS